MTAEDVLKGVVSVYSGSIWNPYQNICIPNSNGILSWEADLLILTKSDYLTEVEIKVSAADFRRDEKTKRGKYATLTTGDEHRWFKHWGEKHPPIRESRGTNKVRQFYFAFPRDVYERIKDEVPEWAGVIVVDPHTYKWWDKTNRSLDWFKAEIIRKPKALLCAKADDRIKRKFLTSFATRYWLVRHKTGEES